MIVKLRGIIEGFSDNFVDLDVQNVVFRVFMTPMNINNFKENRENVEIFIYEILKEDSRVLVGFQNSEEREIFSDLLSVQGVGSKMALNIMTKMEMNDIIESINNEDSKSFVAVSGVGNKLANRIINELKEKIKKKI